MVSLHCLGTEVYVHRMKQYISMSNPAGRIDDATMPEQHLLYRPFTLYHARVVDYTI